MWVRFIERFDWKPRASVTIAYPPGSFSVTRACAEAALAARKAVRQVRRSKDEDPVDAE